MEREHSALSLFLPKNQHHIPASMIDITHKPTTLRQATAMAIVRVSRPETIEAILSGSVPKGDVREMSKAAGLLGVKKTPDLLPDCHPLPIEHAAVSYEFSDLDIKIEMHVKTIYRTGVEVEAMHGASVVALTMYDMLKPIDKGVEIHSIKLLEKKGGKSDFRNRLAQAVKADVVVCSDTISKGQKEDKAGKAIIAKLKQSGIDTDAYVVIPDEAEDIRARIASAQDRGMDLIIFTGGTGMSLRDVTPETIRPLLDREIPGISETVRAYGQERTPYSMLSRTVAGTIGRLLVIALPGSTRGAEESMDALFPPLVHIFGILKGARHD
jgi:cyclic pyranopterin monophosphate synthase